MIGIDNGQQLPEKIGIIAEQGRQILLTQGFSLMQLNKPPGNLRYGGYVCGFDVVS